MKRTTEVKTKKSHSYVEIESNTTESIVADVCVTGILVTAIVGFVQFLREAI